MKASIQGSLFLLLIFSLLFALPSKAQEFDINEVGVTLRQVQDSVNYYADETEDSSEGGAMVRARAMGYQRLGKRNLYHFPHR